MNLLIFEDAGYRDLLPLTWLRPACELRCGRLRLLDKILSAFDGRLARLCVREALAEVVAERIKLQPARDEPWCLVNARALLAGTVVPPSLGCAWRLGGEVAAACLTHAQACCIQDGEFLDAARPGAWADGLGSEEPPAEIRLIRHPWDLITHNEHELVRECQVDGPAAGRVYDGAHLVNAERVHVAAGAVVKPGSVLDAERGVVFIDAGAVIEPNAVVQGPCYVGPKSIVRPGAVVRSACSIGPVCRVGGEIECSVFQGYSNKQHDGFLGHSFVGSWVNLGADTVTSDLKNTYGAVRAQLNGVGVETGLHFLGAIIGDHAKTAIGTMLPTGCIIGIGANIVAPTSVPKFVPSFAWLDGSGLSTSRVDKAIDIARTVMSRRDLELSDAERRLFEQTADLARKIECAGWPK